MTTEITDSDIVIGPAVVVSGPDKIWFVAPQDMSGVLSRSSKQEISLPGMNLVVKQETQPAPEPGRLNEDCPLTAEMGAGRQLVAVLDGASSRQPIKALSARGVKGSFYVSHLTGVEFPNSDAFDTLSQQKDLSAGDVMRGVNTWLNNQMSEVDGVDFNNNLTVPGMAATFCLIDSAKKEVTIAHVADTVACAVYEDGRVEILTQNQNARFDEETMGLVMALSRESGLTPKAVMQTPELKAQVKSQLSESFQRKINTPEGCGILNGMPELVDNNLIFESTLPITPELKRVLVFSDGALMPYEAEGLSTEDAVASLVKDAEKIGVGNDFLFLQNGTKILEADPEYVQYPRFHDDDATIIEVDF